MRRVLTLPISALFTILPVACGGDGNGGTTGPEPQVASVTVTPGEVALSIGGSQQLTATARDGAGNVLAGRSFTWTTSAAAVTTVSETGFVTAVGHGPATIRATTEAKSGTATIVVAVPVATVTVSPAEITLGVGKTAQLTATTRDGAGSVLTGRGITWSSSAATVALVSATGLVRAMGAGPAVITATSEGKTGTADAVIVVLPVASVTIAPAELTLIATVSQQLTATARDAEGDPVSDQPAFTWTTSAPGLASVSATGMVTGVAAGSATITAAAGDIKGEVPVSVIPSVTFASVTAGGAHTCALTAAGAAFCWGRAESGQLGIPVPETTCPTGAGPFACSAVPVAVQGGLTFTRLALGAAHTCGLVADGAAYCWGSDASGQVGDDTRTARREAPVAVVTALKFASIEAGAQHTCALTSSGVAYCWGRNDRGQLGDGTTSDRSVPVPVTGGHTFVGITAGGYNIGHTCALTNAGAAYCWGDNERGQLGNTLGGFGKEDRAPYPVPVLVTGERTYGALSAGLGRHTCGVTTAGAAYCWGENTFGALGDGSGVDRAVPTAVAGGVAFAQIVTGGFIGHTCAVTSGGAAYCWGENEAGQVGDGSTFDRLQPSAVAGGHSFVTVDAGFRHTCGRAATGTVYCWGSGGAGQLGVDATSAKTVPARVVGQP